MRAEQVECLGLQPWRSPIALAVHDLHNIDTWHGVTLKANPAECFELVDQLPLRSSVQERQKQRDVPAI
jgi:hypothetical protein